MFLYKGIPGDDIHVEAAGLLRHQLADVAQANNAQGGALQLHGGDLLDGVELAGVHLSVHNAAVAGAGHYQVHGVLGNGVDVGKGSVAHHDALALGILDVHDFHTHAEAGDELQLLGGIDDLLVDVVGGQPDDDNVDVGHVLNQVLFGGTGAADDFNAGVLQHLLGHRGQRLGIINFHKKHSFTVQ